MFDKPYRSRLNYFESLEKAIGYDELQSQYVHSLNGDWKFKMVASPSDIPDDFLNGHYEQVSFETIPVPSHPELNGFGNPIYTNIDFPMPVIPDLEMADNPTGLYYRKFSYEKSENKTVVLRFDGVDSEFDVWVNKQYIGSSHGSRLMSEFDLSTIIENGQNEIAVCVKKWSKWSFIEDQDMWWLSGIFRDVTIVEGSTVSDVRVKTIKERGGWNLMVDLTFTQLSAQRLNETTYPIKVALYDGNNVVCQSKLNGTQYLEKESCQFAVQGVKEWTDETPFLYTLVISVGESFFLPVRVGFREIKMIDDQVCLNGIPLLINGVNRHEFSPTTGRALKKEDVYQELVQIKQFHINAIRTSHYPNVPYFYDVCDEIGLLVVDECDIESHGLVEEIKPASDKSFTTEFVSRAERMVTRDYNHPCVMMWSLGNESSFGDNFVQMANKIRELDDTRLIHYEGDHDTVVSDVYSTMYTGLEALQKRAALKTSKKPHILCEYAHAMGNGPGSLKEYQDLFKLYPSLQGGFIWEWKDHGIEVTNEGKKEYRFGGGFNEPVNDGDFVIDGLVLPNGEPSPGLLDYSHIIQPIEFYFNQSNSLVLKSRYNYRVLHQLIVRWNIMVSGEVVDEGVHRIEKLSPQCYSEIIPINGSVEGQSGDMFITFEVENDQEFSVFAKGTVISSEQFPYHVSQQKMSDTLEITDFKRYLLVENRDTNSLIRVDKRTGNIDQIIVNGKEKLSSPVKLTLDRVSISNESHGVEYWKDNYIDQLVYFCRNIDWISNEDSIFIYLRQYVAPPVHNWGVEIEKVIWIANDSILTETKGWFDGDKPTEVQRIGYETSLTENMTTIDWYGRGPGESYVDSNSATKIGKYQKNVNQWAFPYVVYQDSGNRSDCRWVKVKAEDESDFCVESIKPFNFNYINHNREDNPLVRIDHFVRGLGSNSCGPEPLLKYRVLTVPFESDFTIRW